MKGNIRWYNRVKGYGFIGADGKDYFVHHTEMRGDKKALQIKLDGIEVEFEPGEGEKGLFAKNVTFQVPA